MNMQTFFSTGIFVLPYPQGLRRVVRRAMKSWLAFCQLPPEVKTRVPYIGSSAGVGYEVKRGGQGESGHKEQFDVVFCDRSTLDSMTLSLDCPELIDLVTGGLDLARMVAPLAINFARQLEGANVASNLQEEVVDGSDRFFLRFIHYPPGVGEGQVIALPHVDQSAFTLHLHESEPGLEYLSYGSREWKQMPISQDQTVIIPAMQLQLRSMGNIRALCHRVVATPATAESGRYSAVCFVQLGRTPKYNKEAHGPLQARQPGFNYQMPFGPFFRLFH